MARYVDGFALPVPRKNVSAYHRLAGMGAPAMAFDTRRRIYGGFEIAVDL